jgi:hypothetical protein
MTQITYYKVQIEDCKVFYRKAGNPEKPAILLLHGFPSSSHMFRELMPEIDFLVAKQGTSIANSEMAWAWQTNDETTIITPVSNISASEKTYDLTGRPLSTPHSGQIYIVNGKIIYNR